MDGIHEILQAVCSSIHDDVLATVVRVEGSAYRKEGAMMLFRENETIGMISAGCLETDLAWQAQEVKKSREAKTIVYDMRAEDDLAWGQGAGCNGVIHVLLEPVDIVLREHLSQLQFHLENGDRATMIKKLKEDCSVSDYLFMTDDGQLFGKWHGGISVQLKNIIHQKHITSFKPGIHCFPEISAHLFIQSFEPKPRLFVFGAGPDVIPLVKLASEAGFSVFVSDWREEFCNQVHFPDAQQIIAGFPKETIPYLDLSAQDSVLLLTHHFQRDRELLHLLKDQELKYLGILGPRNRTKRLLDGNEIASQINSPTGLEIGAEGPVEIAISIVAELIQRHRSKKMAGVFI
ncbi:XdhC family protein [Neobacillus muris]|uniref:XdhC family protein n=1 Tax=Neobacillus muris TaxID=2941334 RepID=UPI002041DB57|nr:XdhC family protein [Neobacillus muris]